MLYILVASHEATKAMDVVQYMKKDFGFYYMFPWYRGINSQYPSTNQLLKENAATQANLEAIDDPNSAMTTIFTSAPSATTNADISLT